MTELVCGACGYLVQARSVFEAEGECPECGADAGSLIEQDAYDVQARELRCGLCGWEVEANVQTEWDGELRVFAVDDDCAMCAAADEPGMPLEPVTSSVSVHALPEFKTARAAASRLHRKLSSNTLPVDVEAIAHHLGLDVRRGRFSHDGMLRGILIEIPEGHRAAERFVIAHEIAHFELRHTGDRTKIEPEANAFASELLIPRDRLVTAVSEGLGLTRLATRFGASRQAIVYALRSGKLLNRLRG
jgi:predicted RNA-binding Zn-ribbon protein involved in translation (DUF1610 family)